MAVKADRRKGEGMPNTTAAAGGGQTAYRRFIVSERARLADERAREKRDAEKTAAAEWAETLEWADRQNEAIRRVREAETRRGLDVVRGITKGQLLWCRPTQSGPVDPTRPVPRFLGSYVRHNPRGGGVLVKRHQAGAIFNRCPVFVAFGDVLDHASDAIAQSMMGRRRRASGIGASPSPQVGLFGDGGAA